MKTKKKHFWIWLPHGMAICSSCRRTFHGVYDDDSCYHYCPHCGARMDGIKPFDGPSKGEET